MNFDERLEDAKCSQLQEAIKYFHAAEKEPGVFRLRNKWNSTLPNQMVIVHGEENLRRLYIEVRYSDENNPYITMDGIEVAG